MIISPLIPFLFVKKQRKVVFIVIGYFRKTKFLKLKQCKIFCKIIINIIIICKIIINFDESRASYEMLVCVTFLST